MSRKQKDEDWKWIGLKSDVFSIELDQGTDQGFQLKMTQINEFRVLILYLIF